MFSTKLEVDKHVANCLKKINSETERNNRSFAFAKLYYNVGDYEQARRYVSSYLNVKPKSPEGHNLLGKALEKLGRKDAALEAYRTSLQLDSKQNNLVLKVCELLASADVDMDQSGARYFCEMAQALDPHNAAVFSLKEKLIMTENKNPDEVTQLLLKELEERPMDVNLRVRLLKHLLQHNKTAEAFKHASNIENKNLPIFANSLSWYETVTTVLLRYQRDYYEDDLSWSFWFLLASVLEKLVALSLDEQSETIKNSPEYSNTLFNFDQTLNKLTDYVTSCPDRQLVQEFLNHFRGQLCFHLATFIFKQAKKDLIKFKEASLITLPLFLAAYHCQPPDMQGMWINNLPEEQRLSVLRWRREGSFRCSQAGHILLSLAKDRKITILEKATQYSTGMWREHLFKKVFVIRDQQIKINSSYFVKCHQLMDVTLRLPEREEILKYDEEAQLVFPDSLHHYVWIALCSSKLSDFKVTSFEGLQYSVKNLSNCGAETLNILDIQAFIYCAALCARSNLDHMKRLIYYSADKPNVLPVCLTEQLCSTNQSKFLMAAYKMYKNEYTSDMGEIRVTLIKGIEVVRCIGRHGLDVTLLVLLANVFAERAKYSTKQSEIEFNDARAELYWKAALPLLEKLKNNQLVSYSNNRMFEMKTKEMPLSEVCMHIDKGKLFIATLLMKRKDHEKALKIFEELKDPYASFYQAQIYLNMANEHNNQSKENLTSELRSQHIIFLSRARDCLYLTLDRLREPSVDRNHPLNAELGTEIEKVERMLSRIDPDCTNRNECDGMSDENVSSGDSTEHYLSTYSATHASYLNGQYNTPISKHSTPFRVNNSRREARPSPERLDAQLRQLAASKDTAINHILDQNKIMLESHRCLIDELRSFREAVYNLTTSVDDLRTMKQSVQELKDIKKSVDELKNSVDELQDFKNVSDLVYEMKREISELKKDSARATQVTDDSLYLNDEDYGSDYNLSANLNFGSNLYQNYQGRLPPAAAASLYPPALYPGLYGPMGPYGYPSIGLPQAGAPFTDQQLSHELRNLAGAAVSQLPAVTCPQPGLPQPSLTQTQQPAAGLNLPYFSLLPGQNVPINPATNLFKPQAIASTTATMTSIPSIAIPSSKAPPVNVVITSSDPLPTNRTPVSQPVLSVTIPPQHIKGGVNKPQPHNYQIPLPSTNVVSSASTPSVLSQPAPTISTQSILSHIAPPVYSALSDKKTHSKNLSLGLQIEKSLEETFNSSKEGDTSNVSQEEHDPCPDFKPIIPLPDEVPLNTGEEDETPLFIGHGKLYRHVSETKEWKERGVGTIKILHNPKTGKVRILMRREQVFKICANHFIRKDMTLQPKDDNAYIWAAHDFADEKVEIEKLCMKFKKIEDAKKFYDAFEKAKSLLVSTTTSSVTAKPVLEPKKAEVTQSGKSEGSVLGGFVFTSTPTFKPKNEASKIKEEKEAEKVVTSPFSNFTFGKTGTSLFGGQTDFKPIALQSQTASPNSQNAQATPKSSTTTIETTSTEDEFVPTVEFKPVIPLPKLIEVKTGEENAETLFDCPAKLMRFDSSGAKPEWKERGVGNIKILKENTTNTIRIIMRREQVLKVCCNHQLLKNMTFNFMSKNLKAITWGAQDFSDEVLKSELFCVIFKTPDLANTFMDCIKSAQASLNENNNVVVKNQDKHMKCEPVSKPSTPCDRLKPTKSGWECKNCYVINEPKDTLCGACETPKNESLKVTESGANFSFGGAAASPAKSAPSTTQKHAWGDAFKPKPGSWECKTCYIRNEADKLYCMSCESPKDDTVPKKDANKGVDLKTPGLSFKFGVQPTTTTPVVNVAVPAVSVAAPAAGTWGGKFKPKEGAWECKTCYISNNPGEKYCAACEQPKDDTIPKKDTTNKGIDLSTSTKFTFGINAAANKPESTKPADMFKFGQATTTSGFSFEAAASANTGFNFKPTGVLPMATTSDKPDIKNFVFGSPQKHDFEFTPRSPRRISSGQGDEESDASYVEEEGDNIYFKPVIPLPDKVDVKTGEEGEDVLYCHRAKLFRFSAGEWKERGVGDIKILKNKADQKLRIVMRRDQVLKPCLNHMLTSSIDYFPKDEKTWHFYAPDFSEGEISHDQFCLRFKNADIAQEFRKAVKEALGEAPTSDGKQSADSKSESSSDVEFVKETQVTPEEESEARKLHLPPKFFAYRQLPYCECDQCKKDDDFFKGTEFSQIGPFGDLHQAHALKTSTPSQTSSISSAGDVFKQGESKNESLKDILIKPPIFNVSIESEKFSTPVSTSVTKAGNLFGVKSSASETSLYRTPTDGVNSPLSSFSFMKKSEELTSVTPSNVSTPGSLFSPNPGSIFSNVTKSSEIFNSVSSPVTTSSIFGSVSSSGNLFSSGANIFSTPTTSTNIFGVTKSQSATKEAVASTTSSIFSSTTTSTNSPFSAGSIFGSTSTIKPNLFGQNSAAFGSTDNQKPVFGSGSSLFGKPADGKPLFGGGNLFGQPKDSVSAATPIFGNVTSTDKAPVSFGQLAQETPKITTDLKEGDKPVLSYEGNLSFSTLAKNVSGDEVPVFAKPAGDSSNAFAFLGAGKPVFGSAKADKSKKPASKDTTHSGDEDEEKGDGADEAYDPHYEPIVPLPEAIVVSTGEEEETILFNERGKLYRYDSDAKEWKERGVGQVKILHHPTNDTYRFLLRREQVFKLVLNQRITEDLDLQPMTTSDKAWMWVGPNHTEDGMFFEQIAVRFKNADIAQQFYKKVMEVKTKLKDIQEQKTLPSLVQDYGLEDVSNEEQVSLSEVANQTNEDDEYDDYDDDEKMVLCTKSGRLEENISGHWHVVAVGEAQIFYDPDIFGARISFSTDGGIMVSLTLIGTNTHMELSGNECQWRAVEWAEDVEHPQWKDLKIVFNSDADAQEFHMNYLEGYNYAQESNIVDEIQNYENEDETA